MMILALEVGGIHLGYSRLVERKHEQQIGECRRFDSDHLTIGTYVLIEAIMLRHQRNHLFNDVSVGHLQSHSESCFRKIPIAHCSLFLLSAAKIFSSCAKVRHSEIISP